MKGNTFVDTPASSSPYQRHIGIAPINDVSRLSREIGETLPLEVSWQLIGVSILRYVFFMR
jgi:hypothetical protein